MSVHQILGLFLKLGILKVIKSLFNSDYDFSKQDLNRIMRILPYQNLYGINQGINFLRDNSGLPDKGKIGLY